MVGWEVDSGFLCLGGGVWVWCGFHWPNGDVKVGWCGIHYSDGDVWVWDGRYCVHLPYQSGVCVYIYIRLLFSLLFVISMSPHDVLLFNVHCCVFSVSFS